VPRLIALNTMPGRRMSQKTQKVYDVRISIIIWHFVSNFLSWHV
jgi:hypothetical protein